MRKLMALIYILTVFLHADNMNTNEKLLLGYSTQEEVSKEALLALKIHFIDNQHLAQLQAQNDLHFKVERLGDYYVTVIYPIHSLEVRNDLLLNLSPLFSDMFYMDSQEEVLLAEAESDKSLSLKVPTNKTKQLQKSQNLKPKNADLGLQWLVLLLLSTVGLIILVRNRKKLSKIKQGQDDMQDNQKKIEIEINTVGAQNA